MGKNTKAAEARAIHEALLERAMKLVFDHPAPELKQFKPNLQQGYEQWSEPMPAQLPMLEAFNRYCRAFAGVSSEDANGKSSQDGWSLIQLFAQYQQQLRWKQTYTKADGAVSDAMLKGYGFVELMGSRGPFVSNKIRLGFGVWDKQLHYPRHRHQAEEIYFVLGGGVEFDLQGTSRFIAHPGDIIFIESRREHGFSTPDDPVVLLYLWQSGDLREKSIFSHS